MTYQILTVDTIIDYLETLPEMLAIFSDFNKLSVSEIGDGNVNFVYRIKQSDTGQSVILKQAVPYLRIVGESFPLTRERMNFEIMALQTAKQFSPNNVPNIYYFSKEQSLVIMQDLAEHKIVRELIIKGTILPHFAEHMAQYLAETLFATSDFYLASDVKKAMVQKFINPSLCKITEDFVFTHPFEDNETNSYNPELPQESIDKIQKDPAVKVAIAQMRYKFMNNAQALLHGDLHIGSIMANQSDTYVIDPEFAFAGPMGFDIGALIGNLYIAYFSHAYSAKDSRNSLNDSQQKHYRQWLLQTISAVWQQFSTKFGQLWLEHEQQSSSLQWQYEGGPETLQRYIDSYLADLLADTIGFAACKMMRRVVGLAKVADFADIKDLPARAAIEQNIINMASQMVVTRQQLGSIEQVNALALEVCANQ